MNGRSVVHKYDSLTILVVVCRQIAVLLTQYVVVDAKLCLQAVVAVWIDNTNDAVAVAASGRWFTG